MFPPFSQGVFFYLPLSKVLLIILILPITLQAQRQVNFDESKTGSLTIPDVLEISPGNKINTVQEWERTQRKNILKAFQTNVYGRIPGKPPVMRVLTVDVEPAALDGKATRKQVTLIFGTEPDAPRMNLLVYLPNIASQVPVLIGLNFEGNHCVSPDTAIIITDEYRKINPTATTFIRGEQAERWPIEAFISRGYGVATAYYGDLEPDNPDGYKTGIRTTLAKPLKIKQEEWGAISAWAWGMSRIVDYLEGEKRVDQRKLVLVGHSRIGKATLWAGSNDTRFDMVVSNNSGEGGASLARRNFGETIKIINTSFPHWFISTYKNYNDSVETLPVDQHMLLALMAPRPLYIASATEDLWADPYGEFLAGKLAGKVYALYDRQGIEAEKQPLPGITVGDYIGYHIREGKHNIVLSDWEHYMNFADRTLALKQGKY